MAAAEDDHLTIGALTAQVIALAETATRKTVPSKVLRDAYRALETRIEPWGVDDNVLAIPSSEDRSTAIAELIDARRDFEKMDVAGLVIRLIDALILESNSGIDFARLRETKLQLDRIREVPRNPVFRQDGVVIHSTRDAWIARSAPLILPKEPGPPEQAPHLDKCDYVVWYGTNRRRNDARDISKGYSAARDTIVHYGNCYVYIPEGHKIGSIGSPWWKRLIGCTDDRLILKSIYEFEVDFFWQSLVRRLALVDPTERQAVVFVHGYNVSFQDAALRAAQIGFDLSIKGAMAFFSWPSQGDLSGYLADAATIEASEDDITEFLISFAELSGAQNVHIIAHSMGNRGVLRAVNRIAERARRRTGVPFGQVILAAADVDADTFRKLSAAYAKVAHRTTLYVSARDRAVEASHWLHHFPRAGLMPPVCVVPGIDTIGVTNVDMTLLGHGYVGEAREVLTDMHQLIATGSPPQQRFGLQKQKTECGDPYWLIRA